MPGATAKREFDIVIHGATSFTALHSLNHIRDFKNTTMKGLKIALSGRAVDKVQQVADKVGLSTKDYPIIKASNDDKKSLEEMCARTRIVLTFVGPYSLYGMPLVEAAVAAGTSVLDITGEPNFTARCVEKYHDECVKKGIFLLGECGFDSLPPELVNFAIHRKAEELKQRVDFVRCAWNLKNGGGVSGGTAHTAAGIIPFLEKRDGKPLSLLGFEDKIASDVRPFCSPPGGFPEQKWISASKEFQAYITPFIMGGVNQKVVRKSNALLGFNASYVEVARTTSIIAAFINVILPFFFIVFLIPVLSTIIKKYVLPAPGTGPDESKTKIDVLGCGYLSAKGEGNTAIRVKLDSPVGYGGYVLTGILAIETAAALANEEFNPEAIKEGSSWYRGGAVTPGAVVGDALIRRLAHSKVNFYVTTNQTFKNDEMQPY